MVFHDFVVEDREIEGKTEFDWVAWWKCDLVSFLVALKSLVLDFFKF